MMDYYENRFGISKRDLKNLYEKNVDNWNSELKQIGLKI